MIGPRFRRVLYTASLALLAVPTALAQRSPAPTTAGHVRMTRVTAEVRIVDGVPTTVLDQRLHNGSRAQTEAIWLLPLPEGAVADGFTMKVGGVEMKGEVLDAGRARGVYENIVRRRQDPGLLEYVGRGCLRARIFPIPPNGDVDVEVVFRQVLPATGGLYRWSLPWNNLGLAGSPPEQLILDLSIDSKRSIRNVFSPTPGVHVLKKDDHRARASFEGCAATKIDELAVFYGLSEKELGLDLLSHRKAGDEEGTFLMMISPKEYWAGRGVLDKEITFVLDISGSMTGRKIKQAKEAVRLFLQSLNPGDRFNVIPFSTGAEPFFPVPVTADAENLEKALAKVAQIEAGGGTNLAEALKSGISQGPRVGNRLSIVVLLTDGLPTVGETDVKRILRDAEKWNEASSRVFVFGVGDDVNTFLLDKLAAQSGGTRDYVREREPIEAKTSALFTKLSSPVLSDLELSVEGVELTRMVPSRLPDLFKGGRILLFGRYRGEGQRAIRLSGRVGDERREYVYEGSFAAGPRREHDFVSALWAERRVGVLLDAIRLNGKHAELLDEVTRLGLEHNIVTPYTSHLIVEEGLEIAYRGPADSAPAGTRRGAAWQGRRGPAPIPVPRSGGGGGGGGPSSPGPSGPAAPGPSGPSTPGPAAPGAPAPTTRGGVAHRPAPPDPEMIIDRLLEAGVLPEDASLEELHTLAGDIAREMQSSEASLRGLGREESGKTAVDDSAYLARLIGQSERAGGGSDDFFLGHGQRQSSQQRLLSYFTKKVGDKIFRLRKGVWIDRAYDEKKMAGRKQTIEAFSDEYFLLLRAHDELKTYLAFSDRLLVVLGEEVFEITPPREKEAEKEKKEPEKAEKAEEQG